MIKYYTKNGKTFTKLTHKLDKSYFGLEGEDKVTVVREVSEHIKGLFGFSDDEMSNLTIDNLIKIKPRSNKLLITIEGRYEPTA